MPDTQEALTIATFNPALRAGDAIPNEILEKAVNEVLVVYDKTINDGKRPLIIEIQNMSIQPVYYRLNSDIEVDAGICNGVPLAGASAANDGLGSRVKFDFRVQQINKITMMSLSGTARVTVERTLRP